MTVQKQYVKHRQIGTGDAGVRRLLTSRGRGWSGSYRLAALLVKAGSPRQTGGEPQDQGGGGDGTRCGETDSQKEFLVERPITLRLGESMQGSSREPFSVARPSLAVTYLF